MEFRMSESGAKRYNKVLVWVRYHLFMERRSVFADPRNLIARNRRKLANTFI